MRPSPGLARLRGAAAFLSLAALLPLTLSCAPRPAPPPPPDPRLARARALLAGDAEVLARLEAAPEGFLALLGEAEAAAAADPLLYLRADKTADPLPDSFEPPDLVGLDGTGLATSRRGMVLRKPALEALLAMAEAARAEGAELVVSSAYRSWAYQRSVFARVVAELGEAAARRESAEPGRSQHQLGLAVDFGSIDDSFALTAASAWLGRRAASFGFSLSYPRGMEEDSGYRWESWHWRYVGAAAAALEARYFGGSQRRTLEFLGAWTGR